MYIVQAKVEYFASVERQRGEKNGGGTYFKYEGDVNIVDPEGNEIYCSLKPGYNANCSCSPRKGDVVRIVVAEMDFNMPKGVITFSDILPVGKKS